LKKLIFIALLLTSFQLSGQENKGRHWQFGLSGGLSNGNVSGGSSNYAFTGKNGFQSGLFINYFLGQSFALSTEFNFERRGFELESYNYGLQAIDTSYYVCWSCYYASKVEYQSFYLTIPLYMTYKNSYDKFDLILKAGIYYSLLLEAYQEGFEEMYIDPVEGLPFADFGYEPGYYRNYFTGRTYQVVNTYDVGALLGLGFSFDLSREISFFADASVYLGMAGYFENPQMIDAQFKSYNLRGGMYYSIFTKKKSKKSDTQQYID
jgi:hypothetical protein